MATIAASKNAPAVVRLSVKRKRPTAVIAGFFTENAANSSLSTALSPAGHARALARLPE